MKQYTTFAETKALFRTAINLSGKTNKYISGATGINADTLQDDGRPLLPFAGGQEAYRRKCCQRNAFHIGLDVDLDINRGMAFWVTDM